MEEKVTKRRGRVILSWSQRSKKDYASIKYVEKQNGCGKEESNVSGKQPTRTIGIAEWAGNAFQTKSGFSKLHFFQQNIKKS